MASAFVYLGLRTALVLMMVLFLASKGTATARATETVLSLPSEGDGIRVECRVLPDSPTKSDVQACSIHPAALYEGRYCVNLLDQYRVQVPLTKKEEVEPFCSWDFKDTWDYGGIYVKGPTNFCLTPAELQLYQNKLIEKCQAYKDGQYRVAGEISFFMMQQRFVITLGIKRYKFDGN